MEKVKSTKASLHQSNNADEHHTLHTKLLTDMDKMNLTYLNKTDQSFYSLDDFTGGPIYNTQTSDLQVKQYSCEQNNKPNRSITTTPAESSGGFHNTLSVLECHLNKTKYPNLSLQQIEYLLLHKKDVAIHTNSYIDIPIDSDTDDNLINKKSDSHTNDGNFSSLFELELEAMDRLQSMWDKSISPENFESSSFATDLHLSSKKSVQNVPKSNEYIYHIARSRNGQLYLRVRRNSCLDEGITSELFLY